MKNFLIEKTTILKGIALFGILLVFVLFTGCNNSPTAPSLGTSTDGAAMQKAAESDSSVASFDPNYNEGQAMSFMRKTTAEISPVRVGQIVRVVNKNFTYNVVGDTSYATFTRTFEGVLYIVAVSNFSGQDTTISKPFTSTITLNLIFVRVGNSKNPTFNWRLAAVSLPEGGTLTSNVVIENVTVFLPTGDTISVNSPNDYYITREVEMRGMGRWRMFPSVGRNNSLSVQVTINSAYADTDFVTLTHGGDFSGLHKEKLKLDLISSTPSGSGYVKVYQGTYKTHNWHGYHHAVINAFPKQVIFDDSSPVEISTWGIPYFIR
ncbi:MAG: hypothetical protein ACYCVH_03635 [Ignavibacteriaceae bacterium]